MTPTRPKLAGEFIHDFGEPDNDATENLETTLNEQIQEDKDVIQYT